MRCLYTAIVIITFLILASCRSSKPSGGGEQYVPSAVKPLDREELGNLFSSLEKSYGMWKSVKVPVSLKLQQPKKFSISGVLTMERDCGIHLSLRVLGMEMASLTVTGDSLYAVYKLERLYFAESVSDLLGGFPATVGNVQDLILGRAFVLGSSVLDGSSCKLAGNSGQWTITPTKASKGVGYSFTVDATAGNVESLTVEIPARRPISAHYSDFAKTEAGPVAGTTEIAASTSKSRFTGELTVNTRRAEWNGATVKKWSVPKGYTRVKTSDVMRMLSKF